MLITTNMLAKLNLTQLTRIRTFGKRTIKSYYSTNSGRTRTFCVNVEGNISSGKTTLLEYFQENKFPKIQTHFEPVEKWTNLHGENLLQLFYTDMNRWCFLFQGYVQLTRFQLKTEPPATDEKKVQIYERSLASARYCFLELFQQDNILTRPEFLVLNEWFITLNKLVGFSTDLIVYVRTSPEVCLNRLHQRSRAEETTVTLDYLKRLHTVHDDWLLKNSHNIDLPPILIINGDQSKEKMREEYEKMARIVFEKLETNDNFPKIWSI